MNIGTKQEMNHMDAVAINDFKIPGILLMEHAAYGIFLSIKERQEQNIVIVCGPGNNGGDGLALARQLVTWTNKTVKVVLVTSPDKLSADGKVYYTICKNIGVTIEQWTDCGDKENTILQWAELIIDAIFGTGITRPVEGLFAKVIECINNTTNAKIVSVDIPSGIASDNGYVMGVAIEADETFTFQIAKVGLHVYPGLKYAGKVHNVDIGIPRSYLKQLQTKYRCIVEEDISCLITKREIRSHKGTYGKVLIVGGSKEMSGAVTLTTKAAMKAGAGTVTVAVPDCIQDRVAMNCIDAMTIGLGSIDGHFSSDAIQWIKAHGCEYDVITIGPGLGRSQECDRLVESILQLEVPCVIDADGLYGIKAHLAHVQQRKSPVILTPHPKEFERLSDYSIKEIMGRPLKCVEEFIDQTNAHIVLKIERSIIGTDKEVWINTTGNPGLAKGGSGDVLAGIITGVFAWSQSGQTALKVGTYIHGALADCLVESNGEYSLLPSELIKEIGTVLKRLEDK